MHLCIHGELIWKTEKPRHKMIGERTEERMTQYSTRRFHSDSTHCGAVRTDEWASGACKRVSERCVQMSERAVRANEWASGHVNGPITDLSKSLCVWMTFDNYFIWERTLLEMMRDSVLHNGLEVREARLWYRVITRKVLFGIPGFGIGW